MSDKKAQSASIASSSKKLENQYKPVGIQAITAAALCNRGAPATAK
ncbi:hypothetical protein TRICHSKD4_0122 [Roseibium sp. TrichSKD4]|nr:hypothetical protein [Roseibium sp. TrichSKD4]EFO34341.1 hypothetical protein TRICHSKD4_0122 [Roseibium sp. TrichSKD4]